MSNNVSVSIFVKSIDKITELKECKRVVLYTGDTCLFIDEFPIEIKVGDNKVKATTFEFLQAVKDVLDTGVFELDQIDSAVWEVETKLEEAQRQLEIIEEYRNELIGGLKYGPL